MNSLLKYKKDELLSMCKKCNHEVDHTKTKAQLADILIKHIQSGGRFYKCQKGKKVELIESRKNPYYEPNSKYLKGWICNETNLTKDSKKNGCSVGLKTGKKCKPCTIDKKGRFPKECKGCVSGNNIFYCKK